MRIEAIDEKSSQFSAVKQLWRANSDTLGFLPAGAFEEYAANENILVALDAQGQCVGYLLFRCSRHRIVTIHHLCVSESMRGQGVASQLVDRLKAITTDQLGIRLSCRRDFEANRFWPTQGFVVQTNRIYETFGVLIISHAGLICKLDEFRRETEYKAHRLAGTLSTIRRVQSREVNVLAPYFQRSELRETKAKFQQRLRQYLAEPIQEEAGASKLLSDARRKTRRTMIQISQARTCVYCDFVADFICYTQSLRISSTPASFSCLWIKNSGAIQNRNQHLAAA
jgi:predicted GNAT family acetyltransferase